MRDHPDLDVNWQDPNQWTPLRHASFSGHAEIVKLLLAHPNIEVNLKNYFGETPILLGCNGRVAVVELLLKDPRVDVTLDDTDGCTPLWLAVRNGYHEVIEWLMASGRDLGDIKSKKGRHWGDGREYTALEIARVEKNTEVVSLLERFMTDPIQTRHEVRVKLGMLDALAAEVFALTVFLCDEYECVCVCVCV